MDSKQMTKPEAAGAGAVDQRFRVMIVDDSALIRGLLTRARNRSAGR